LSPGGFRREEISEKDLATVVIDGSDESPFLLNKRRPKVKRSVMLYQGTDGSGQHLTIMNLPFLARFMAVQF